MRWRYIRIPREAFAPGLAMATQLNTTAGNSGCTLDWQWGDELEKGPSRAIALGAVLGSAVAILLLAIIIRSSSLAVAEPLHWNNMTIEDSQTYENVTIIVDGNLTVNGTGSLTLVYCVLNFNSTKDVRCVMLVKEGGSLVIENSTIQTAGGTFVLRVEGQLRIGDTELQGLEKSSPAEGIYGIEILGNAYVHGVMTYLSLSFNMRVSDGGSCEVDGCTIRSEERSPFTVEGQSWLKINDSAIYYSVGPCLRVITGGHLNVTDSTIEFGGGIPESPGYPADIKGPESVARFDNFRWSEMWSEIHAEDCTLTCIGHTPDIVSRNANVSVSGDMYVSMTATGGSLNIRNYTSLNVELSDGCIAHCYGPKAYKLVLSDNATYYQYYPVDFLLLNEMRSPAADNSLLVETKDRVVVIDTRSDEDGWVRGVWLLSWTRKGATFSYEPPHRVEFGDVDYSITRVQVYGNTTVTLWNSPDQRDLVLLQDAVSITDRSPREGDPFDVVVKGALLIPYTYPNGTSELVLYIDGKVTQSRQFSPTSRKDLTFKGLNLSEGMHEVRVVVDPTGLIPQMNRNGNDEARVMVEVASRNYTGDEIDLYVRVGRIEDTDGNTKAPLAPGVLDVHFTVRTRYSTVVQRNVQVQLLVNGEVRGTRWVDLIRLVDVDGKSEYSSEGDIPLNLPEGTYTIELVVDPGDDFIERYENNNADSATVEVATKAVVPFLDNWDDPAVCIALGVVALVIALFAVARNRLSRRGGGAAPVSDVPPAGPKAQGGSAPAPSLAQPQSSREASTLAGAACPACGGGDVVGYPDGSARCQSCKAVFYSR